MKKLIRKEIIIGVSVLFSLLVLFFGIDFLKGINVFKAANYYYASYTNVSGLAVSAPVTVNGFKIGLIRNISYEYDNPGHVLVELSLDKELKLPEGTVALLTSDMLGTASIQLQMGTSSSYHKIGDKILGDTPSGLMDNVTNEILPSVANTVPKVDSLLTSVNMLASNPALEHSIRNLETITNNLATLTASLSPIMHNVKDVSNNLTNITKNLNTLTTQLNELPLDSTMNNIHKTTENIRVLTDKINEGNSSLGLLLNDTKLYDNLTGATGSLDSLLIDIKKNPKRYISIKLL